MLYFKFCDLLLFGFCVLDLFFFFFPPEFWESYVELF